MIVKTLAVPLAVHPYAGTSRVVHWFTRQHGKVSTLLKGAFRPRRNPFAGGYQLFATSELLYRPGRTADRLYPAVECALVRPRDVFRVHWRRMLAASYFTALLLRLLPEEAPDPDLFTLFEELLDFAAECGDDPAFLPWAEMRFCAALGHAPNFQACGGCGVTSGHFAFNAAAGGVLCSDCAAHAESALLALPPDLLDLLRRWQGSDLPPRIRDVRLSPARRAALDAVLEQFLLHQFRLPPRIRRAALAPRRRPS